MPIFSIKGNTLEKIEKKEISEKKLQNLIEKSLENIMGIKFLTTEYPIPNGRIDTLGLDENGTPVVIEYKKKQDPGAIIQGLFYVNWLSDHKPTFEKLVGTKLGKGIKVDWSLGSRLIIIAEAFDIKEISAINQVNVNVELKIFSYHGNTIAISDLSIGKVFRGKRKSDGIKKQEIKIATLEERLANTDVIKREAFLKLRDKILNLGDDVQEKLTKDFICYSSGGKGMAWFKFAGKQLVIYLRKGKYLDKKNKIDIGWGGCPTLKLREKEIDVNYLVGLLSQAYRK
jgi:predicted transport protein